MSELVALVSLVALVGAVVVIIRDLVANYDGRPTWTGHTARVTTAMLRPPPTTEGTPEWADPDTWDIPGVTR